MQLSKIRKILSEYKDVFETLRRYDETGSLPNQKKRIDITLSIKTIDKLKNLKAKTGKPISMIIEEKFSVRKG